MFYVYDSDYDEIAGDPFDSINEAAMYILSDLPHEDFLYMIGTGDGIDATVFQGLVYYPEANVAGMLHARAEAADATLASCNRARQAADAECDRLREQVATLRHAFQFVMNATGNRFSITSINVATAALDATAN